MNQEPASQTASENLLNPIDWQPGAAARAPAAPIQFISFAIGDDQYGVDIMAVREIKGWSEITHLPNQPEYVRGVLNLRGVIVPIIDLRCRFGQGLTEAAATHIVIIVQIGTRLGRAVWRIACSTSCHSTSRSFRRCRGSRRHRASIFCRVLRRWTAR